MTDDHRECWEGKSEYILKILLSGFKLLALDNGSLTYLFNANIDDKLNIVYVIFSFKHEKYSLKDEWYR